MKKLLTSILFIIFCMNINAQNPDWLWAKTVVEYGDEYIHGNALDANGNLIVMGSYTGSNITFGTTTITNTVNGGNFLVKYDASGNVIWAKSGNAGIINEIHIDSEGNIYVTGYYDTQTITIDTITLTNTGNTDAFIVKYDSIGNVLWAKSATGSGFDFAWSVTTDNSGNIYLTGDFRSQTLTFGSIILNQLGVSSIFVVKFNPNGNVIWAKVAGGNDNNYCRSISVDSNENVYIGGHFTSSSINFGSIVLNNEGLFDIFVAKYNVNGNALWAKAVGGNRDDYNNSITTDLSGNIYITGYFLSPSVTFETTTLINTSLNNGNLYIAKYNSNGNLIWAKTAGGTILEVVEDIYVDANQNVYVTGYFLSPTVTFGTSILTNASNSHDVFVAKFNYNGQALWGRSAGGSQSDFSSSINVDVNGNMFISGNFVSSSITFGSTTLNNGGPTCSSDMFVAKLGNTTGISDEIKNKRKISVLPNPFIYSTTIHSDIFLKDANLTIYDIKGQPVKQIKGISGKTITLFRDNLSNGMYFIRLMENNNIIVSEKIIIVD